MTITFTPDDGDLERRLREAAARYGKDADVYARELLAHAVAVASPPLREPDDEEDTNPHALAEAIERLRLTPERVAEARARSAHLQPRNPPPPGTSGMDRVYGKWPGDETDEEVEATLEAIE